MTKPECACGFVYRPPQRLELQLAVESTQHKPASIVDLQRPYTPQDPYDP